MAENEGRAGTTEEEEVEFFAVAVGARCSIRARHLSIFRASLNLFELDDVWASLA